MPYNATRLGLLLAPMFLLTQAVVAGPFSRVRVRAKPRVHWQGSRYASSPFPRASFRSRAGGVRTRTQTRVRSGVDNVRSRVPSRTRGSADGGDVAPVNVRGRQNRRSRGSEDSATPRADIDDGAIDVGPTGAAAATRSERGRTALVFLGGVGGGLFLSSQLGGSGTPAPAAPPPPGVDFPTGEAPQDQLPQDQFPPDQVASSPGDATSFGADETGLYGMDSVGPDGALPEGTVDGAIPQTGPFTQRVDQATGLTVVSDPVSGHQVVVDPENGDYYFQIQGANGPQIVRYNPREQIGTLVDLSTGGAVPGTDRVISPDQLRDVPVLGALLANPGMVLAAATYPPPPQYDNYDLTDPSFRHGYNDSPTNFVSGSDYADLSRIGTP